MNLMRPILLAKLFIIYADLRAETLFCDNIKSILSKSCSANCIYVLTQIETERYSELFKT